MADTKPRIERDLLGEMELPGTALYGIQTARALANFDITGQPFAPELVAALVQVKMAAALANQETGHLDLERTRAIVAAGTELLAGKHADQFPVDALQGGAGTSSNQNVNEVMASLASQISGLEISPSEHLNLHQSTNDVYPTALRVAAIYSLGRLEKALVALQESFQAKEREFADVVKLGRTQLQDAVPITLGREFGAYAEALSRDRWRIFKSTERLRVVNLGGTAIGTGIAAPRDYILLVVDKLREVTGLGLARAENLVDATQNQDAFVEVSGMLRAHAVNLIKIARDLRLLSSGPKGGLGEIELPALQPGSSLMPGKVNPVMPEMTIQACYRVMAYDQEIQWAAMSGDLELNAFMPLLADALLSSLRLLERTDQALATRCIAGIKACPGRCLEWLNASRETATAFIPEIGHPRAVEVAQYMREHDCGALEAVTVLGFLSREAAAALLEPGRLNALGWKKVPGGEKKKESSH